MKGEISVTSNTLIHGAKHCACWGKLSPIKILSPIAEPLLAFKMRHSLFAYTSFSYSHYGMVSSTHLKKPTLFFSSFIAYKLTICDAYEHIIYTSWLLGPNYNEAQVFTSKSAQILLTPGQGNPW